MAISVMKGFRAQVLRLSSMWQLRWARIGKGAMPELDDWKSTEAQLRLMSKTKEINEYPSKNMAEVALTFAAEKLGDLLMEKVDYLQGVEGQVKWLKGELETMQCFLQDASEKQANQQTIRKWISDIRELAQDAEDIIDTFILKVDNPRRIRGLLEKWAHFPGHVYHLDRVGEQIKSIRARLRPQQSRQRYDIQDLGEGNMVLSRRSEDVESRRRLSPWQKDKHVVGLEEDVELLIKKAVLEEMKGLSVSTIVGMGGSGKSTLARIVYNHAAIADQFDRRAWVCVSSDFNPEEVISELVLQVVEPNQQLEVLQIMEKSPLSHLKRILYERLQGKRYFIVVDDVWEDAHWEALASAFPDDEGFFKEDAVIRAKQLVQVWIAQGLVPLTPTGEETMEDIGTSYLDELINRNMVQVKDMTKDRDRVKTCHIHDLLRELSITKANEEISFQILRKKGNFDPSLDKIRHCAIYGYKHKQLVNSKNQNKHIRSLFMYEPWLVDYGPSYWKSFELLRVLNIEGNCILKLPDAIGDLTGLRYLGLKRVVIMGNYKLPSSIGRLKNLQVLAIRVGVKVPNVIWKLDSLRHLYMDIESKKCASKIRHTEKSSDIVMHQDVTFDARAPHKDD
ncbi:hypothetical protein DH2020_021070 [Rehmannia glutinosa]|uniref:Uncharacterized protein n=1 Tax=Rehmannia glutinosa TaxID=99300 RepID=A0ABR0WDK0_REHGL